VGSVAQLPPLPKPAGTISLPLIVVAGWYRSQIDWRVVHAAQSVLVCDQPEDNKFRSGLNLPLLKWDPDTSSVLSAVVRENGSQRVFSYYAKGNGVSERKCVPGCYAHAAPNHHMDCWSFPKVLDFDLGSRCTSYVVVFQFTNFSHPNPRTFAANECISRYAISFFSHISQALAFSNLLTSVVSVDSSGGESTDGSSRENDAQNKFPYGKTLGGLAAIAIGLIGISIAYLRAERLGVTRALCVLSLSCAVYGIGLIVTFVSHVLQVRGVFILFRLYARKEGFIVRLWA
jgi:hypothetical protein